MLVCFLPKLRWPVVFHDKRYRVSSSAFIYVISNNMLSLSLRKIRFYKTSRSQTYFIQGRPGVPISTHGSFISADCISRIYNNYTLKCFNRKMIVSNIERLTLLLNSHIIWAFPSIFNITGGSTRLFEINGSTLLWTHLIWLNLIFQPPIHISIYSTFVSSKKHISSIPWDLLENCQSPKLPLILLFVTHWFEHP